MSTTEDTGFSRTPTDTSTNRFEDFKDKYKKPSFTGSLCLLLILNIVMFCVGVLTINDCPVKDVIPIFLIIAGAIGVITKILPIMNRNRGIELITYISGAISFFEVIWGLLGIYWIYSIYEPSYNPSDGQDYCNKTAYLLAFWLITIHLSLLVLFILSFCCCFVCIWMANKR